MNQSSPASGLVRRIDLRFDVPAGQPADYPVVTVLIDGEDLLTSTRPGFAGFGPEEMLGPDSPLLPAHPWRRVAVYRCSCGIAGCGVIAPPIINRTDGRIVWTDFRDYTGVFDGPTVESDPDGGHELNQRDLVFDARQYAAEVGRASADRTWESARRLTARLLKADLIDANEVLAAAGYELDWVSPMWQVDEVWELSLSTGPRGIGDRQQLLLELTTPPGEPADRAHAMAARLLALPAIEWPTAFASRSTPGFT